MKGWFSKTDMVPCTELYLRGFSHHPILYRYRTPILSYYPARYRILKPTLICWQHHRTPVSRRTIMFVYKICMCAIRVYKWYLCAQSYLKIYVLFLDTMNLVIKSNLVTVTVFFMDNVTLAQCSIYHQLWHANAFIRWRLQASWWRLIKDHCVYTSPQPQQPQRTLPLTINLNNIPSYDRFFVFFWLLL